LGNFKSIFNEQLVVLFLMETINLIQDLASPHNNVLIKQFKNKPDTKIKLWYALEENQKLYQGAKNIANEHFVSNIYGLNFNWQFIKYCLTHKDEKFVIVGWANTNTKIILLLFFLFRRRFTYWTDLPNTLISGWRKKIVRWFAYKILKYSKAKVFAVGITGMKYFQKLGFSESRLVNFPIFVETDENIPVYLARREEIYSKLSIFNNNFVLSAGSRIIYDKGYDLLIKSIAHLNNEIREKIKVIIVGSGSCVPDLEKLITDLSLEKQIVLVKWLAIEDFKAVIANSDVFIHPARLDSYGGTTLGMALGVPVIGSYQAGAAVDRIVHGVNGYLYEADDIQSLASFITLLYQSSDLRKKMALEARKTALQWPPSRGLEMMVGCTI